MLAIREDLSLQRQERAAGVHEIDTRQPVVERDLLRPEVLLHRDRVVGASLDGSVVGHDQNFAARDASDASDDACRRSFVVVKIPGCERGQLEEWRALVEQLVDPFAHRQLALGAMPLNVLRPAPLLDDGDPIAQLGGQFGHSRGVRPKELGVDVDVSFEKIHGGQPTSRSSRS